MFVSSAIIQESINRYSITDSQGVAYTNNQHYLCAKFRNKTKI